MEIRYEKQYSHQLGRDMEFKIYGHAGKAMLYIPCQNGRFFDFENFRMHETMAPWIESGRLQVFSVDTIDAETWSNTNGDPRWRIERHEQWVRYLIQEIVPQMINRCRETNHEADPKLMVFGASMGAMHAGNLYFRFPDIFDSGIALSGMYDSELGFGHYMDDLVYMNSPVHFLSNMPEDHPYMDLYRRGQMIICVGQGAWENETLPATRRLDAVLKAKNIPVWVDFWGHDVYHDWPWWYRQTGYFMTKLLGEA